MKLKFYLTMIAVVLLTAACCNDDEPVIVPQPGYVTWAGATYKDGLTDEERSVTIEYNQTTNIYRVKNMMEEGTDFYFTMDEETNIVTPCDENGTPVLKSQLTSDAYYAKGYKEYVSWAVAGEDKQSFVFNKEKYVIELPFNWVISKGSFGKYACTLTIKF